MSFFEDCSSSFESFEEKGLDRIVEGEEVTLDFAYIGRKKSTYSEPTQATIKRQRGTLPFLLKRSQEGAYRKLS